MRDAIHIAVTEVIASVDLVRAQRISVKEGIAYDSPPYIGIVDPYGGDVEEGQTFRIFLNPDSITGLRHHWTHPAFDDESIVWLTNFAQEVGITYDELMLGLRRYVEDGTCIFTSYDTPDICRTGRHEMWRHFQSVTGIQPPTHDFAFRCAC